METKGREEKEKILRFSTGRIVEHWLHIATFAVLVATGLSQKFYYLEISRWFILTMGGIDAVRLIHHYTGAAFALLVLTHLGTATIGVLLLKWQATMMIAKKDFLDAVHNIRYYIGLEGHPAACDRFDYKEKFVYWLVLTGGLIMTTTGLTLWFPITVVRFLPGEVIPAAKALHSNEALLIFLLIAIWHIYDSIFSPDVFPLDTSIFTGYISRETMQRLHPLEMARLQDAEPEELFEGRSGGTEEMSVKEHSP